MKTVVTREPALQGWRDLRTLAGPDLSVTPDGVVRLFVASFHDHLDLFISHAGESEPSVAIGDEIAVVLCREAGRRGDRLTLALHELA